MKAFSYIFKLTLITEISSFLNCHSLVVIDCQARSHFLIRASEGGTASAICTSLAAGGGGAFGQAWWGALDPDRVRPEVLPFRTRGLGEGLGGVRQVGGRGGEQTGQEEEKWTLEPHCPQPF